MSINGAEFRKSDFQIHSPRDAGWHGARPEDGIPQGCVTPETTLEARLTYCRAFINKCVAEKLRAVAITDHHEGIYPQLMLAAKANMEAEVGPIDLWIFPGMELTCKDSSQAIIIFDADLSPALFEKVRSKLGLQSDCNSQSPTGIAVSLLGSNIEDIQGLLIGDEELRDRFIVLPHVKPGGHKTILRTGFHKRFKEMPYVGGYMDQCYPHELNPGDLRILNGEIPAWSSEKRGVISTSDGRHADFRLIGKHASWVKLATPKAESLRQAMLAPDSRIRHEEPKIANAIITALRVTGANYLKDDEYLFNVQMNSIIGGRGAGKSSLLEYIRFALGCSALDGKDAKDDDAKATRRMREMLHGTLKENSGTIAVDVLLNGAKVTLTRTISSPSFIQVENQGKISSSTAEAVSKLVSVQSFRQGELSDLARDELAGRLLGLVTAGASESIDEIENSLKRNGQQLSEALAKAVLLTSAKQRKTQLETELEIGKSQSETLQLRLSSATLHESEAFRDHDSYIEQQRVFREIVNALEAGEKAVLNAYASTIELLTKHIGRGPYLISPEISSIYDSIRPLLDGGDSETIFMGALNRQRSEASEYFQKQGKMLVDVQTGWKEKFLQHQRAYDLHREQMSGMSETMNALEEVRKKLKKTNDEWTVATKEEVEFKSADSDLEKLLSEKRDLHQRLVDTVKAQIVTIDQRSSNLACGVLSRECDLSEVSVSLRAVLAIPLLRDKRIDDLLKVISDADDPRVKWDALLAEMLDLLRLEEGASNNSVSPATPMLLHALDENFLQKLRTSISSDLVAGALRAVLRPKVDLFQKRGAEKIEFRKASQGEQAATLLNILMNQSRGPLIIDQPEEDLDNKIINDIIKTMRQTKEDRQLILATHNANIVVNGDSELVIEMHLGAKQACGAIDEIVVREAITATMEGGKDAFELRRKKYNY